MKTELIVKELPSIDKLLKKNPEKWTLKETAIVFISDSILATYAEEQGESYSRVFPVDGTGLNINDLISRYKNTDKAIDFMKEYSQMYKWLNFQKVSLYEDAVKRELAFKTFFYELQLLEYRPLTKIDTTRLEVQGILYRQSTRLLTIFNYLINILKESYQIEVLDLLKIDAEEPHPIQAYIDVYNKVFLNTENEKYRELFAPSRFTEKVTLSTKRATKAEEWILNRSNLIEYTDNTPFMILEGFTE